MNRPLVANLVLLGFGASRTGFPFGYEEILDAVGTLGGTAHRALNREAVERGRALAGSGAAA